jgi:ABC-2 type transport system permease protein
MPIYEQSYRRYEQRGALKSVRFWPIMREPLRGILGKRAFMALLFLASLPLIVRAAQIYAVTNMPALGVMAPIGAPMFGDFLNGQIFFAILLAVFGGSGLIANDLRTGAILVYLSRPLTRRDYVLGKLGVILGLTFAVTLLPGVLLYFVGFTLAPATFRTWDLAWLLPAIVLQSTLISLTVSLLILAISALSRSARIAGLGLVMLYIGTEMIRGILRMLLRVPQTGLVSIQADLKAIGVALFGNTARGLPPGWMLPALVLAVVGAACLLVLRKRVRAVEVVA